MNVEALYCTTWAIVILGVLALIGLLVSSSNKDKVSLTINTSPQHMALFALLYVMLIVVNGVYPQKYLA
jgi:hypothetical protein